MCCLNQKNIGLFLFYKFFTTHSQICNLRSDFPSREILTSLPRFDLVTLTTFHENSNRGRKNYWKSWVRISAPDIWFVKLDFQKWLKNKVFYGEFENEQKNDKKILTFRSRDSNPRFSVIFLPKIWIFLEGEGDEIKSKQASKRGKTLILSTCVWGRISQAQWSYVDYGNIGCGVSSSGIHN